MPISSAAPSAATCAADLRRGRKATSKASAPTAAITATRSGSSEWTWPQTLNGESRSIWLAIVRCQKVTRPGSMIVCAITISATTMKPNANRSTTGPVAAAALAPDAPPVEAG